MPKATYQVFIAWEPVPSNAFVLNGSALDGTDQLTNKYSDSLYLFTFGISKFGGEDVFASAFDALYSDVSDSVISYSIKRGRDDNLSNFNAGEATIVLSDPDGTYSPLNTSSPLHPNVLPGRPVLIQATYGGVEYGQYRGFIRSIEHNPNLSARTTTVHCQDLFLHLTRSQPTIEDTGATTTGAAIQEILTAIDWTDPDVTSLETGDTITAGFSADGTKSALSLIGELLETERGEFYISREGVATYKHRHDRYTRSVSVTFTDVATEGIASVDLTNIKNRATVQRTGGTEQVAVDYPSATNYGYSDYSKIDSTYLDSDEQALSLAEWLVSQGKDPKLPLRSLTFPANISSSLLQSALTLDIGSKITVSDSVLTSTSSFYIEGIAHNVRPGRVHTVSYQLSQVPTNPPIIFGTFEFDSSDIFAY